MITKIFAFWAVSAFVTGFVLAASNPDRVDVEYFGVTPKPTWPHRLFFAAAVACGSVAMLASQH